MSRIRPAVEAQAHAASVEIGAPCTICGDPTRAGGMWAGVGGDIYVCSPQCARKLLLLALDTVADHRGDCPAYEDWLRTASDAFDRWEAAYQQQGGR